MTSFQAVIAEVRSLKDTLRQKRGTLVGIECKQGQFAVTETRKEGRKSVTTYLTGWQAHYQCVDEMRRLAS